MDHAKKVLIIGGGLAGLISAIELARKGWPVQLVEKKAYPFHKVCGEYVSNEVLPYLQSLGVDPLEHGAKQISRFQLSATSGRSTSAKLPLGGFGISRYALDQLLYQRARALGCQFTLQDSIQNIQFQQDKFTAQSLKGQQFEADVVIGAQGKRSALDKSMDRSFIQHRTSYMGVKCHYKGDFPEDLVALHNFQGGYCGLSMVENGHINVCYLSQASNLKPYANIKEMELELLSQNPHLREVFHHWEPVFEQPLAISQIYFRPKPVVEQHLLMAGDAAGLIYPLCGNGMAMAIHAAKMVSEEIHTFLSGKQSRAVLEANYQRRWKRQFASRLRLGQQLQRFFGHRWVSGTAVLGLKALPFLKKPIIRMTHGSPIETEI